MSDDKDKNIRRLKKLMALTSSSNANEASAALVSRPACTSLSTVRNRRK
ncbi:hypothetical protein KQ746_004129 [Salmonella enterica]|nr:hypothetical protein [Salmonella enterica]EHR0634374.1 hypothetical protein [Salmonella enterica]EIC8864968.1 hypothetical protein [Salmonella enterica]EIF5926530.1 hypothetical protein [Salmonella enterica]EIF8215569.1 hypothetical protein [Salmonella enterica]